MKKYLVILLLLVLGGAAYGVRTFLHDRNPVVKADRLAADGKLREALVEMRGALRDDPRNAQVHVKIAQLQAKLADPVAAEKEFRTAIQLGADRAALLPDLGESILVQGRPRDVLRDIPARGAPPATLARILLLRAVAQLSLDDVAGAEATLVEAEKGAPDAAETSLIAARVAAARNKPDVLDQKLRQVLERDPTQVEALLMQEKLMTLKGDRPAALQLADRAVKAAPWSAMARIERASQYIFAGDDEKAQADVNAVLAAQPRFMDAIYLNGILLGRRGKLTEAASQLEKLEGVSGKIPAGLYFQALIALQQGNMQTAADFARRYNQLVPQDPDGARLRARLELSANRPAEALPLLQRLAAESPKDAEVQDMLGRTYAVLGKPGDAAKAFTTSLESRPGDAATIYHAGAQRVQVGDMKGGLLLLEKAYAIDPKTLGLGAMLAETLLALNDLPRAETVLAQTRADSGDNENLVGLAAAMKSRQKDIPAARAILVEGIRKFPGAIDLRVQLAQLLSDAGQPGEAIPILQAILATDPARFSALTTLITIRSNEGDLPGAIKDLEAARRAAPRNLPIAAMLADTLTATKNPRAAIDIIRDAGPDGALGPLLGGALARAQAASGKADDAIATYRGILSETPGDLVSRGALAQLLSEKKDFPAVAATIEDGLKVYPGNYTLMSGLVANAARAQNVDAGLAMAQELRKRPGTEPFSAMLKGDLLMASGRPKEAGAAYAEELARTPSVPLMLKATGAMAVAGEDAAGTALLQTWLKDHPNDPEAAQRLSQFEIKAGRYPEATANLAIVLAAAPNNPVALNNLAWIYATTDDSRALATAQRAYLSEPSPLAGDTLGWALVKSGSAKAAVPLLQRAAALRPNDPGITYHLAAALAADNQKAEALKVLLPVATGPAFPDQAAARKLMEDLGR